ncbi:unnamed protein product [Rotaria magnacalcarata]|uniref:ATP-dependent DNA helicase n=4 Tax=Rotaria magnacalcarata TaxID=392030 RepID=A0A819TCG2_9BILA|nr:unnamed protein product [Rotaria magnacalcarata]CAF4076070.1 unnamed protein product [Rotaria magnacalcarata]
MNFIKNGDKQFFYFINGDADVGKSTLIKAVYQSILRLYNPLPGSNPDSIRAALCAPTGKAAALIDGMTLQLLIIDEISMVGFTMFQHVDARLQQIMRTKKPFGGISVIVLGDFNQLRPVGDKYIFQFNNSYNALVDNPLWSLFELFELTEIMRQKDDKSFAIALSNIGKGTMTLEDINLLKSQIVSTENLEIIEDAIRIFRSNAEVDAYNTKVLASLSTEGTTANAYDFCVGDGLASIKEKVLSNVKNLKTTETYGLPLKIDLKVGAKYMMTVNSDTEDGLVNGACGKLVMIGLGKLQKTNETVPCRIWIKFNGEKTGRKARVNFYNVMRNRNIDSSLTPIEPVIRQINTKSTNFKVEWKQFPIVPCKAMIIYKSQGGTYEKVVVNLKKGTARSELYVACSRSTKASGLYLIGDFVPPKPPEHNDSVTMMFKTMRSERMVKFSLEFPEESQGERFSVIFHDVQSLNKNILDTKPNDSLEIEGFKVVHRRDCNDIRKPFGQITYLKNHLKYESIAERCEYSGKNHIEYSSIKIYDICIISVYNSPNSPFDVLKRHINEAITASKRFCENIIVVGDFNINLKIKTNYKFIEYMKSFGLTLINKLNKNSTNANTQIDYCFANANGWKCDYFESLTSFHKPLWIRKHGIDSQLYVDENEQIRTDMPLNLGDLSIDDRSDVMDIDDQSSFEQTHTDISFNIKDFRTDDQPEIMEIDEQSSFENYEMPDEENDQIHTDVSFNLKELKTNGLRASTIFGGKSPIETYEIVDLNTRRILDHFLLVLDSNNTTDTDQISIKLE